MSDAAAFGFPVGIWCPRAHTTHFCPLLCTPSADHAGAAFCLDTMEELVPLRFTGYPQKTLQVVACIAIGHHI